MGALALAFVLVVSGGYPAGAKQRAIDVAMAPGDVASILGEPDKASLEECGPQDARWECLEWTYRGGNGELFVVLFARVGTHWRVNSWRDI